MEEQQRRQLCDLLFEVKQKLTDQEYKDMMETLKKPKPVNIEGATLVKLTYEEHTYPDLEPLWDNWDSYEGDGLVGDVPKCLSRFSHRLMVIEEKVSICEVETNGYMCYASVFLKAKIHPKVLFGLQKMCEKKERFYLSDLCAIVLKKIEVLQRK